MSILKALQEKEAEQNKNGNGNGTAITAKMCSVLSKNGKRLNHRRNCLLNENGNGIEKSSFSVQ